MTRTRDGIAQGGALERQMADNVADVTGFRTSLRNNPDGTITMLRTRGGALDYTTSPLDPYVPPKKVVPPRGFVAHIVAALSAIKFSPYLLTLLKGSVPVKHTYAVMPITSGYNTPLDDTTNWRDVLSFDGANVLVNGKKLPAANPDLGELSSTLRWLPWVIPDTGVTGTAQYGVLTDNRVFAVSQESVHSWGIRAGATHTTDEVLLGSTYRPTKAIPAGPRVDPALNKAWLSQFVYTGSSWDDNSGGWMYNSASFAMLLTDPYLTRVTSVDGVGQPSCVPAVGTTANTVTSTGYSLPPVDIAAVGTGVSGGLTQQGLGYSQRQVINFYYDGLVTRNIPGTYKLTASTQPWVNSYSQNAVVAGRTLVVSASNSLSVGNNSETYEFPAVSIPLFTSQTDTGTVVTETTTARIDTTPMSVNPWYYDTHAHPNLVPRGTATYTHALGNIGGSASFVSKDQVGTFSISVGAQALVYVSFTRNKESGNTVAPIAVANRYANLPNPGTYGGLRGGGGYLEVRVESSTQDLTIAQITAGAPFMFAAANARANSYVGGKFYDTWPTNTEPALYTNTVSARAAVDNTALNWSTKDFILYDDVNGVYICVEGVFVGTQSAGANGTGTLTVRLRITTPGNADVLQTLLVYGPMTYGELLPESNLSTNGAVTYIQSPRLSALFTPMYQEQGLFRGAAYTTQDEAGISGMVPAYLFNFVLKLDTFAQIGQDNSATPIEHFIPCNLLEMLYAYVFSSRYGQDQYQRYPVDYTLRFSDLNTQLFTPTFRISYRNGTFVDWLDALGGDYITHDDTEIYRV